MCFAPYASSQRHALSARAAAHQVQGMRRRQHLREHGRQRSVCKECGGGSICEHGRVRSTCRDCGGASICEHGRRRGYCKECGGGFLFAGRK